MTHIALVDRVAHLEIGGQDSTLDHRLDGVGVGGGDGAVGAVAVDDVPCQAVANLYSGALYVTIN